MKTLNLCLVEEMTRDELFLIEGGNAKEAGQVVGKALKAGAEVAEAIVIGVIVGCVLKGLAIV